MTAGSFNDTIDSWIAALDIYNDAALLAKPSPDTWSIGQVYMHLIKNTHYFLEQVKIYSLTNDHAAEEMSPAGKTMLGNNAFPDAIIEGPSSNNNTAQPESKEILMRALLQLKTEIMDAASLISKNPSTGKTKHPGLHYFNASEWLQFAGMHFRHHLRQKMRIDEFLRINKY